MPSFLQRALAVAAACLVAGSASAQDAGLIQSINSQPYGNFGVALARVGDVNGDGVSDLLVGAFQEWWHDRPSGRAYVHDGQTGRVLYALRSPVAEASGAFGVALTGMGDVDGDGVPDLAVGAPLDGYGGQAYIYSGASGDLLRPVIGADTDRAFAHALADAGDADGDGVADLLVGDYKRSFDAPNVGVAYVVSGATGGIVRTLLPPQIEANLDFGRALAGGDVTGDGVDDWIVAARRETVDGRAAGRVHVYSGADGALVVSLASPEPTEGGLFGLSLAVCADFDGDGVRDVVVGAGRESHRSSEDGGAYVFSGTSGLLLRSLRSPNPAPAGWFGQNVTCVEDVDTDGVPDVAVGATGESHGAYASGTVYVMSGATGAAISQVFSSTPAPAGRFGSWLASMDKLPGASLPSLAVGAYNESGPEPGAGVVHIEPVALRTVPAALPPDPVQNRLGLPTPNPSRTHLSVTVTLAAPAAVDAHIVDMQGRTVARYAMGGLEAGEHRLSFGTGALAAGRYTLRVQMDERAETRPFTVVR